MARKDKSLVILGGTSAVAVAFARLQAQEGRNIILVGRNKAKLETNKADLEGRGASGVQIHVCDLGTSETVSNNWKAILKKAGQVGEVLLAYGLLGDQEENQKSVAKLHNIIETNFTSAALWCELAFDHMTYNGEGQLTVIGSVAGDRGRQSNYHYGATKGALEVFCDGMSHRAARLKEAKVKVLLVKPGFIDTPMTDHLDKGGPLWASPEKIAKITDKAIQHGRQKIYAPWFWRFILLIIRYVPRFVFHKTGL